ncbi:MAG: LysR family transcriptional regulator, partial [Bdellovibrionota bacterium]
GVRLTRAGEEFLPRVRTLISDWEGLRSEFVGDESRVRGRFSLGCHTAVARYALTRFLPQLLGQNPELEIVLRHDLSRKITDEIIHHRIDFGLVINPKPHPEIVIRELLRDRVTLWANAKKMLKSMPGSRTLLLDPELLQSQALLKALKRKRVVFDRQLTGGSLEVLAQLASAGAGVAILPERVAKEAGALLLWGAAPPEVVDRLCLVYRADSQRGLAGRTIARSVVAGLV